MKFFIVFIFISLLFLFPRTVKGQSCTALGQNPVTAFPVCGNTIFQQQTVPICTNPDLPVPGCDKNSSYGKNPYWYKFTCFQAGSLSFLITPNNPGDDYDWQLFDITGKNPNDVYSDPSLVVTGNWCGTPGETGANSTGVNFIQCASDPTANLPRFAKSPTLILGHTYLLLVSHFDDTQTGYGLSFGGGTAVITDPKLPLLQAAEAVCDGVSIKVKLNKEMKCSSLAADGSDFTLNVPGLNITGATTTQCNTGFAFTDIILTVNGAMPAGTFTLTAKNGTDNNTLLDNCDRQISIGDKVNFTVYPLVPTPMDSLTKVLCAPRILELVFRKNIQCNSIAADGSDFFVTGPGKVVVQSAAGVGCAGGLTKKINVTLSAPMQLGGIYTIFLNQGSDGNTILDECSQQTPAGSALSFVVSDTVNADFSYSILYGCKENVVSYQHDGRNKVNSWQWNFDNTSTSNLKIPVKQYTNFQQKSTQLIVTNGVCSDTSSQKIFFDNLLEAHFDVTPLVCPDSPARFINNTVGRITNWEWNFGNGSSSILKDPLPQKYNSAFSTDYNAFPQLIVKNDYGCYDTLQKPVRVVFTCFIAVPSAFTPNGDGLNDYLYPLKAYKAVNLKFVVYNRFGQKVFHSEDWTQKWDGKIEGIPAAAGTYVWMLEYTDTITGKNVFQKGTTVLIR